MDNNHNNNNNKNQNKNNDNNANNGNNVGGMPCHIHMRCLTHIARQKVMYFKDK